MKVTTDACLFGAWSSRKIKQSNEKSEKLLDIGAGTGLLTLMVLQNNKETKADAIEIDKETCEQAKDNIQLSPWKDQVNVINEDIRNSHLTGTYDIVITNPPFYENELKSLNNKKNVAHHSDELPMDALFGIITRYINERGRFYVLLPNKRYDEIEQLLRKNSLHAYDTVLVRQSVRHDFFRVMIQGGRKSQSNPVITELSICDEKNEYTQEFKDLLKDYYLHL